jgi:histidinol-phosphate aminotransferase
MAFASAGIIDIMNKIKPPYNINEPSQELASQALDEVEQVNEMIRIIVSERNRLANELQKIPIVQEIFPSDANFLLVRIEEARKVYEYLLSRGIVVRDRSTTPGCADCLRITVGTPKENDLLLSALSSFGEIV